MPGRGDIVCHLVTMHLDRNRVDAAYYHAAVEHCASIKRGETVVRRQLTNVAVPSADPGQDGAPERFTFAAKER